MASLTLFAPGKLFLFGEWSVLEGAPALLMATPGGQRGSLHLTDHPAPTFTYHAPTLLAAPLRWRWRDGAWRAADANDEGPLALIDATLQEATAALRPPRRSVELSVEPEGLFVTQADGAEAKLGLGSSGSVSALVARAAAYAAARPGEGLDLDQVFRGAFRGHRRAQGGRGSGADVAVSVFGGVIGYRLEPPPGLGAWAEPEPEASVLELEARPDLEILAAWTGREADTRVLMSAVRDFERRDRAGYGVAIRAVGDAAAAGVASWRSGGPEDVLDAVRAAAESLDALGRAARVELCTAEHRAIAAVVSGVVGRDAATKLSGAGGGDMAIVVARSGEAAVRAREALRAAGFLTFPMGSNP
ncbi:MAG: hypothetical protein CMH57_02235 [Myxococcales bacterium]|nr:hypothetical protein [Myxococcales bacterium]